MSYTLCDKIKNLEPYDPISGSFKIRLDANESFINLSDSIEKKICKAITESDFNRYPDPYCVELCKKASKLYNVPEKIIVAGNGSDELISIIFSSLLQHGDKVLSFSKDFSMYKFYGSIFEKNNIILNTQDDLSVNIDSAIEAAKDNDIKAVIFSNPCNPTSLVVSREDVLKLVESVNCLVIVDEAYMDFSNQSVINYTTKYDNLIVLKTCSKAVGLASIRLGFAISNLLITKALKAAKSPYNVNSITQLIGTIILDDIEYINGCVKEIISSRNKLYEQLTMLAKKKNDIITVYPTQTNFVLMKLKNSNEVFEKLLNKSIAVRKLGDFIRISAGTDFENSQVVLSLDEILK